MAVRYRWLLGGVLLASGALTVLLLSEPPAEPSTNTASRETPGQLPYTPTQAAEEKKVPEETRFLTADQMAMLESPEFLAFERRLDFQQDVRSFFDRAGELSEAERQEQANSIAEQLAGYESAGQVGAAQALTLRLALVQLQEPDPAAAEEAANALVSDYQAAAEQGMEDWRNRRDPEFERYKQREAEIVAEVTAMAEVPDGQERSDYLRKRLLEARIEAHKAGTAPSPE